ncbi:MAG: hypothetical protein GY696_36935 [Gammaproteobacteria bacterium]|nr:hypothetical protein [Gammaproteobacteria bacterium]
MIRGCIGDNNNQVFSNVDIAECMQKCKEATLFVCRSIDYRQLQRQCSLSDKNAASAGSAYHVPCHIEPSNYLYRYCKLVLPYL